MKRLAGACLLPLAAVLLQAQAVLADDAPFRTVIDGTVPPIKGLSITGAAGGCDLVLQNQTNQDVVLFDLGKPPKPIRYPAASKQQLAVHLAGAWPCATLPAITEDQRWNHAQVTVLLWSLRGQVGSIAFQLKAHTLYDPVLDPASQGMLYLRIAAGALAVGSLLVAGPYLFTRRRQILARPRVSPAR